MTISGMCMYLEISFQAWQNYKQREGFIDITTRAEQIIRTQKFQGAAANLLNPNIIARDLGLAYKNKHTGTGGAPLVPTINLTITREKPDPAI